MTKGTPIHYTAEELAWIKANGQRPRAEAHADFVTRFGRADVQLPAFKSLCKRNGWMTGRTGCFEKGQVSWNKGKPHPSHPNSAATTFKKGNVPKNVNPMGDERVDRYGYIEVKVPVTNPYTGHSTRYIHKHRWNWEQANGQLPKGMALKCLDGDRRNCDPANWIAVPRALLPRLAGGRWGRVPYDQAPAELRPALLAIAKLEHAAREKRKQPSASRKQVSPNEPGKTEQR